MIIQAILNQIRHNPKLNSELCYDEITTELGKPEYKGYTLNKVKRPNRIVKSENFQYVMDTQTKELEIINKYYA